jgi:hypothetical protein
MVKRSLKQLDKRKIDKNGRSITTAEAQSEEANRKRKEGEYIENHGESHPQKLG